MERITDHAERAIARLPSRHRSKASILDLVRVTTAPIQEIEDVLFDILAAAGIDASEGEQLNVIGRLVGQERGGLDDPAYRIWLRARQLVNRSSGTVPELLAILRAVLPPQATITVTPFYPAGLQIQIGVVAVDNQAAIASLMRTATAGGVRVLLEYLGGTTTTTTPGPTTTTTTPAPLIVFTLDVGPGLDVGHLADAFE
jgi:hypothetical protein